MNTNSTKIFVSYTLRDGLVTDKILQYLYCNLAEVSSPFIHLIEEKNTNCGQLRLLKMLLSSHLLILIESPLVYRSPWVLLELFFCRLKFMPILKIKTEELKLLEHI
jgi:hypothetical protein